ncbi:hypothetical protein Tco_0599970 [Tanacetum coccineum]
MMTARKRVGPLPTHHLAVRHSTNHSSLDSSSEASSDFHSDTSSDSSSRHPLSDHSSPDLPSTFEGPSCKRRRSPMTSVPALSPVSRALSPIHADLIPSPKRVKDSGYLTDVEVDPKEISLRDDAIVRVSDEPHLQQDTDPEIQAEIDECIAYTDALRDRGIDARVVVEAVDQDEIKTGVRGPVEVRVERVTHPAMLEDIPEPAQEGAVEVTYETLGDLVQRFHDHTQTIPVHLTALTKRVAELERDNMRLRGTVSVESQRVDRLLARHLHFEELFKPPSSFEEMEALYVEAAIDLCETMICEWGLCEQTKVGNGVVTEGGNEKEETVKRENGGN